jgi:DnaJ-class molecular chaperone
VEEYYKCLGASPKDTPQELRSKWLKKCREHHPDKGGDPAQFRAATHAYKMLTDASYQQEHKKVDLSDILTFNVRMPVSFEEAFFGKSLVFTWNRMELDQTLTPIQPADGKLEPLSITLVIPPGSMQGLRFSEAGKGLRLGEHVGDVQVQIIVRGHPKFKAQDLNILSEEKVPLEMLLRGGKIDVQTMFGIKELKIPPGTQPGEQLKIKHCGVNKKGAHLVTVLPIFPTGQDLKDKRTLSDLDIDWTVEEEKEDATPNEDLEMFNVFRKI